MSSLYGPAPESAKPALNWIKKHRGRIVNFISGNFVAPSSEKYFFTVNPATEEKLASVASSNDDDVNWAMRAAERAYMGWSRLSGFERGNYLYAIAREMKKNAREFAVLESLDNGKPFRESRDIDVPLAIEHFEFHGGLAQLLSHDYPKHIPHGVVAAIIPWNFPLLMAAWKIAPYIAAGNTVVLKPAESTPLTAARLAEVFEEVGLPPGVVNIIFGDGEVGSCMVRHDIPRAVAFTGSTEVGKKIRLLTAGTGKHLSLELGGKSPFIVFADADLDAVADGLVDAIWFNNGQVCCAGSRLIAEESIYESLIGKIKWRMSKLRGAQAPHFQLDKAIDLGAVNSEAQKKKIESYLKLAEDEGLEVFQPADFTSPANGFYCPPTLISDVPPSSVLAQEEIFGPVLVAMTFRTTDEAIELANNTRYGLAANVWTESNERKNYVVSRLKAGTVWVNTTNQFDAAAGFGGYKESGFGREGGREGLLECLQEVSNSPEKEETDPAKLSSPFCITVNRTYRLFIGGKLARPDGELSYPASAFSGEQLAMVADANRKDVRNAVEAAQKAVEARVATNVRTRAKLLRFIAENLAIPTQQERMIDILMRETGRNHRSCENEVVKSIERLFYWAGRITVFGGEEKKVPGDFAVASTTEPLGVVAIRTPDDYPLIGFVSTFAPAFGFGNGVVMVTGKRPVTVLEFLQVLENSDMQSAAGAFNLLTSSEPELRAYELAQHEAVDAVWYFGSEDGSKKVEELSISNMKRTWVNYGNLADWLGNWGESLDFARQSVQYKNVFDPISNNS